MRVTFALLALLGAARTGATVLPAGFDETVVAEGFLSPTSAVVAPDGRIFVTEQAGAVREVRDGVLQPDAFLEVDAIAEGDLGLVGIALHPDFPDPPWVYLYYSAVESRANRLSRFLVEDGVEFPGEEILMEFPFLGGNLIHVGGAIGFLPDGTLLLGVGDSQKAGAVQVLQQPYGKVYRLEADGTIPEDNPFVDVTTGFQRAVYAFGVREPFWLSIHPTTGRVLLNDVGQSAWEEIDEVVAGANYGWPLSEGPTVNPGETAPLFAYPHASTSGEAGCAITKAWQKALRRVEGARRRGRIDATCAEVLASTLADARERALGVRRALRREE